MALEGSGNARSALTELLRRPKAPSAWGPEYCLWVHDDNVSHLELVLNPDLFPESRAGEHISLVSAATKVTVYVRVSTTERGPFKQSSFQVHALVPLWSLIVQLSLHKEIAEKFAFEPRRNVHVVRVGEEDVPQISSLEIKFRDQYIGRLPMRQILSHLQGQCLYVGKRIDLANSCVKAKTHATCDTAGKVVSAREDILSE